MGYPTYLYMYIVFPQSYFSYKTYVGRGLVSQILRWPSSACAAHHGICGPCLQLDFLHAQTSRQAYGRLANMRPDSS